MEFKSCKRCGCVAVRFSLCPDCILSDCIDYNGESCSSFLEDLSFGEEEEALDRNKEVC